MIRAICCPKSVTAWLFCALTAGFSPYVPGQQPLAPLHTVNVPNFTIPFEFGSEEFASSIKEVELLVSKDRGKRWYSTARQPVASQKFAYCADTDGEYWFAFRTTMLTGTVSPMPGQPQLRVLVNTKDPMIMLPTQPDEPGPLTPPKPMRYRDTDKPQFPKPQPQSPSLQQAKEDEPKTEKLKIETPAAGESIAPPDTIVVETINAEKTSRMVGPKLPGFELPQTEEDCEEDILDALLSEMSPFLDIEPILAKALSGSQIAVEKPDTVPNPTKSLSDMPVGKITGIILNNASTQPQIVVNWNSGNEFWQDAQIDILRSSTKEGERIPIAINLPNSGEYWWFLSPEDLKPFYVMVRIRSLHGGTHTDVTQSPITIDPRLALFRRQQP